MSDNAQTEADAIARITESIKNADSSAMPVSSPNPDASKPAEETKQTDDNGKDGAEATNKSETENPDSANADKGKEGEAKTENGSSDSEKTADDKKVDKNPFGLPEEELNDLLGLPKQESETVDTLRVKYANSSREAHRLVELEKARQAFFNSQGLKVVQDEEGKFNLVATEEFEKKFDPSKDLDVKKYVNNLSEDDKEMLVTEPEKVMQKVATKIAAELLAKRPPVSQKRIDTVITDEQREEVWANFVGSKLQDGKTARYPDADNPAVVQVMQKIIASESPAMEKFRKAINSDPDLHYVGLEHLYLKARNAMLEGKLRQVLTQNQKQEQKKKIESKPIIPAGGKMPTNGQAQAGAQGASMDAAQRIAQSIRDA